MQESLQGFLIKFAPYSISMGSRIAFFILRWFSRRSFRVLYALSDFLYPLLNHLIRYRRKVVAANLRQAFPAQSQTFYKRTSDRFYRNFSDFLVESIKIQEAKPAELMPRVRIRDGGLLQSLYDQKRQVVLLSGHFFNWEWYTLAAAKVDFDTYAIYKKLKDPFLEARFKSIRSRYQTTLVPMEETYRAMVNAIRKRPSLFVFNADQRPHRSAIRYELDFLGVRTPVFTGYDKMARKLGMAVVYSAMRKVGRGQYEIQVELITENAKHEQPYFTVHEFYKRLAESIGKSPDNYLWSHKRWKYKSGIHYNLNP